MKSIWPSEGSAVSGSGTYLSDPTNRMREFQLANYFKVRGYSPLTQFVAWQFDLSAGAGLNVNVSAGVAWVEGYRIENDAASSIAVSDTPPGINFIYAVVSYTGSLATDFSLTSNTTGSVPTHGVMLGRAVASGGAISTVDSSYKNPRMVAGTYVGNATNPRTFFLGFKASMLFVVNATNSMNMGPFGVAMNASSSQGIALLPGGSLPLADVEVKHPSYPYLDDYSFQVDATFNANLDSYQWIAVA